ncbi:PP0621 family protein [Cupriavidus sp. NPDC089707]|uniref:PP0621 family protein n=1 Tax=Cupriavidus sp. NPDC089707 TaxID=3363963 RepID=UPI00381D877A
MARILILLAVVLCVFWWLRARAEARRAQQRARQQASEAAARANANAGQPAEAEPVEPMVQCAQCGVHLPMGEAIAWRGLHYCRRSHLPDEASHTDGGGARP